MRAIQARAPTFSMSRLLSISKTKYPMKKIPPRCRKPCPQILVHLQGCKPHVDPIQKRHDVQREHKRNKA